MNDSHTAPFLVLAGRTVYVNGRYVPEAEAGLTIFDSESILGDLVFEITRSFNHKQLKISLNHEDKKFLWRC